MKLGLTSMPNRDTHIDIPQTLENMSRALRGHLERNGKVDPAIIGIHTGGVWIAQEIHQRLKMSGPIGELNIAFYRDDFSRIGMHPTVEPSVLPFNVDDRHLVLIDDILFTGRTIRAAMNEIFDYGRPASITLVALIDRSGRELPVQADIVGETLSLDDSEHVKLHGPDSLSLEICKTKTSNG